jgi:hypothetical protein
MRSYLTGFTLSLLAAMSLAACNQNAPSTTNTEQPATEQKASVPGEINEAIPPDSINLAYAIIAGPAYDAKDETIVYKIQVANNGKVALSSTGSKPVNLGVVILGPGDNIGVPPGKRDFVRVKLPRTLEPGQSLDVTAAFKVEPTIGGSVVLDAVQEGVRWFGDYKKPTLALGAFQYCDGNETEICTADGEAIPAVTN